jgi:perosamine synthetase
MTHSSSSFIDQVVSSVRNTVVSAAGLHEPEFRGNELAYLKECLDTGWVSTAGPFVTRFEEMLAERIGSKHAISTSNGTVALQVALQIVGVCQDDEVLMPSVTFVATANAASYLRAVPHFVDSSVKDFGIDVDRLRDYMKDIIELKDNKCINRLTGRRIAAVVCMHTFGHPNDLDPLVELCDAYDLPLVEDAAEALGSNYKGSHVGKHGKVSVFSFNGNKISTTGGGGAIITDDSKLATRAKHLVNTAKVPHRWEFFHDEIGYNYRMPNINAALGCAQLEQLDARIKDKRKLADRYIEKLSAVKGLRVFLAPNYVRSNYWLNTIILDQVNTNLRNDLLNALNNANLASRPLWTPMHMLPMYINYPRMELDVAEDLFARTINLPSSACLGRLELNSSV